MKILLGYSLNKNYKIKKEKKKVVNIFRDFLLHSVSTAQKEITIPRFTQSGAPINV